MRIAIVIKNILRLIVVSSLCAFVGCGYGALREEFDRQPAPAFTIVGDERNEVAATPQAQQIQPVPEQDTQSVWLQEITRSALQPAPFALFDFETETARRLRTLATAPDVAVKLNVAVSLELLLCLAYERNPRLENLRKLWQASIQRYSQAEFLTNLLEQYAAFTRMTAVNSGPALQAPMTAEKAPFPKSLALSARIVTTEVELARLEYQKALRDLVTQISGDYWELIWGAQAITIYDEQIRLLRSLEVTSQSKFKAGASSYGDLLGIQTTKAQTEVEWQVYRQELDSVRVRLLAALNLPLTTPLDQPKIVTLDWLSRPVEEIRTLAQRERLEIQQVRLQRRKMQEMIAMARAELYPNVTTGLSYTANDAAMAQTGFPQPSAPEPVFAFGQRESYLRELRLQQSAMAQEEAGMTQETAAEVQTAYVALDTAWRTLVLDRDKVIPLAEENVKVIQAAYQAGQDSNFLDVLNAARMLLQARLDLEKNRRDYAQKLALIEKLANQRLSKP